MIATRPSTKDMLIVEAPTRFPNANEVEPFQADSRFSTSSGTPVPKATRVIPITNGGTPKLAAKREALVTVNCAPVMRRASPEIRMIYCTMVQRYAG